MLPRLQMVAALVGEGRAGGALWGAFVGRLVFARVVLLFLFIVVFVVLVSCGSVVVASRKRMLWL